MKMKVGPKAMKMLQYLVRVGKPVTLAEAKRATGLPGQIGAGAMTHLCNKYSNLVYKVQGEETMYVASPAGVRHVERYAEELTKKKPKAKSRSQETVEVTLSHSGSDATTPSPIPILSAAELLNLNAKVYIQDGESTYSIHLVPDAATASAAAS